MTRLRMTIIPQHRTFATMPAQFVPYTQQYIHQVDLDDGDYTAEDLGEAMLKALELAHKHPGGPEWFHHFTVHFEVGDVPAMPGGIAS